MKKLLTILGAIGLVATGSVNVVSCSHKTVSQTFKGLDSIDSNWGNIQPLANFYTTDLNENENDLSSYIQNKIKVIIGSYFKNFQDVYDSNLTGTICYKDSVTNSLVELNKNNVDNISIDENGNATNVYLIIKSGSNSIIKNVNFINIEQTETSDDSIAIDVQKFVRDAQGANSKYINKDVISKLISNSVTTINSIIQTYNDNNSSNDDSSLKEQIINTTIFNNFVRNNLGTIVNTYLINTGFYYYYDEIINNSQQLKMPSSDFIKAALSNDDNKLAILNAILKAGTTNNFAIEPIANISIEINLNPQQGDNNG